MQIAKLQKLCKSLGGDLIALSSEQFDNKRNKTFYECPFARRRLGLDFTKKKVLYADEPVWTEIVHEMGHVFACKKAPPFTKEWSFLGWEYAVCLYLGGDLSVWKHDMRDYVVEGDDQEDFGSLSDSAQNELLVERLKHAQQHKLVSDEGVPLTVRRIGRQA